MKARVKKTGKIVELKSKVITSLVTGKPLLKYVDQKTGVSYFEEELFFPKDLADEPDYWTRLEHQYAGMAMQGILSGNSIMERIAKFKVEDLPSLVADLSIQCAHALVEKARYEENPKELEGLKRS